MTKKSAVKKIDKSEATDLNNPKCSTFASAKDNNPACKACLSNFKARYKSCIELSKKALEKKVVKKIAGLNLDCFGFQISSDTHKFVNEIAKKACTMKSIKSCAWNSRPNTFYCAFGKLQKSGYAKKDKKNKTLTLTSAGLKKLNTWKESQKEKVKKVA